MKTRRKKALASNTPADLEFVDQNVKNFNAEKWYNESYWLYQKAIKAKYTQNESLLKMLVESHPRYILRVHESSRSQILNSDPSYLYSDEIRERQWKDFLLMELRETIIFKDMIHYTRISSTDLLDENMSAPSGFYSGQYVSTNNGQCCPDEGSQTDPKFQDSVQDVLNSNEQRGTPPGTNGAGSDSKNADSSQPLDSNDGHESMDGKRDSHESMKEKNGNLNNKWFPQEQMENNHGEYGLRNGKGWEDSEQQENDDNSKTIKDQDNSVVVTDDFLFFSGESNPFSDDYICEFTVDGITFQFINQYMFYRKADFFQDNTKMKAALQLQNGKEFAAADKSIKPYDHWQWFERCEDVYEKGIESKNEYLKNKLLESHSKIILTVPERYRREIISAGPQIAERRDFQDHYWKEMVLMRVRNKLVKEGISRTDNSDNTTSAFNNDNSSRHQKDSENTNNPTSPQTENSVRVSKKDRMDFKYRPSNLYFYNDNSGLSNGHECDITLDHFNFRSMDEYMLYRKAELFKDDSVKEQILRGEEANWSVKNFDRDVWFQKRKELYFEGIQAKFSQNPDLQNLLLNTHPKTIVYAKSEWVKSEIVYYGLTDWYMNKHHWSEVLQMKLRDQLLAATEDGQRSEAPGNESSGDQKEQRGKESKDHTRSQDFKDVTNSRTQSTKRGGYHSLRHKNKKSEKESEPQSSRYDNDSPTHDGNRKSDEASGQENSDLLPSHNDVNIVVKLDSSGQRKAEIELMTGANTGLKSQSKMVYRSKVIKRQEQLNNNANTAPVKYKKPSPNTKISQSEENVGDTESIQDDNDQSHVSGQSTTINDHQKAISGESGSPKETATSSKNTSDAHSEFSDEIEKAACTKEFGRNSKSAAQPTITNESKTKTKGPLRENSKPTGSKDTKRIPESPSNYAEPLPGISHKDKKHIAAKTSQKQKKSRPPIKNYRNRKLEKISSKNRCLLVENGSELSSDFQCQFNIDGLEFYSVKQYIQYCKADHFHDDELKARIMETTEGQSGLAEGMKVRNFDPESWYANMAEEVTWSANEAKFTQNEDLKQILYDTYPSLIQDIVIQDDSDIALSRMSQRIQHRLKSVLTELRDELMRSDNLID